ncbi:unnamed protein product [Somion occarium]|uniref:TPR-like protein n=1 Tax=Somion occarium TaxID=3059160 RepID=A0ABP1DHN7_9APHY
MSLPLLVNGADCGPSNPLQGLSKRFDQDRGIQQDYFGPSRAGSSRETFRSQYAAAPGVDRDAAHFFSKAHSPVPVMAGPSSYDLSALHKSLPEQAHTLQQPMTIMSQPTAAPSPWANDFMQKHNPVASAPQPLLSSPLQQNQQGTTPWAPIPGAMVTRFNGMMYQHAGGVLHPASQVLPFSAEESRWKVAFQSQDATVAPDVSLLNAERTAQDVENVRELSSRPLEEADEFARTAGVLLDTVKNTQNPKFRSSQFLTLMKQVRDKEVVIEGSDIVQRSADSATNATSSWATDFQSSADLKGKGRALDVPQNLTHISSNLASDASRWQAPLVNSDLAQAADSISEDPVDAYFRQENEDYIKYWNEAQPHLTDSVQGSSGTSQGTTQAAEWERLQADWDAFDATATGLKPISNYQFQPNNPYLLDDSSTTRHHAIHSEGRSSLYEMEAAVQRNRTDAHAWYELGVRQQENEREQKAIHALRRALELDPTHLASWLALAVSHTNEGSRHETYNAIRQWVDHNEKYCQAVGDFRASNVEREDMSPAEKVESLAQCLMAMARSDMSEEIDPDIQIALAVLLNANEEYDKSRDCFTTALAVRPDDWLLYNRVGATLANSGHPEEALQYYYRALELNPAYIRARFNLGISCINLRRYEEASQAILDALVLQDSDSAVGGDGSSEDKRGVTSSSLWDSLKTCCLHLQRIDLATICDKRDLDAFRLNFHM